MQMIIGLRGKQQMHMVAGHHVVQHIHPEAPARLEQLPHVEVAVLAKAEKELAAMTTMRHVIARMFHPASTTTRHAYPGFTLFLFSSA